MSSTESSVIHGSGKIPVPGVMTPQLKRPSSTSTPRLSQSTVATSSSSSSSTTASTTESPSDGTSHVKTPTPTATAPSSSSKSRLAQTPAPASTTIEVSKLVEQMPFQRLFYRFFPLD